MKILLSILTIFSIIFSSGCYNTSFEDNIIEVLISNENVGCSNDGEGFQIVKGYDVFSNQKVGEIVVVTFDSLCCDQFKKEFINMPDSKKIVAHIKCYYSKKAHQNNFQGCRGSHLIKIIQVVEYKIDN